MSKEPLNPLDYADDPEELFIQREFQRMGIDDPPPSPEVCPGCGGPLEESSGYVGETIAYCPNDECPKGVVWEDCQDAIRRVI